MTWGRSKCLSWQFANPTTTSPARLPPQSALLRPPPLQPDSSPSGGAVSRNSRRPTSSRCRTPRLLESTPRKPSARRRLFVSRGACQLAQAYVVTPSETARNAIRALSAADRAELADITSHIEHFLPALRSGGLVKPCDLFGIDGERYFDNLWPHMIFMEVVRESDTDRPGEIFFHRVLAATVSETR